MYFKNWWGIFDWFVVLTRSGNGKDLNKMYKIGGTKRWLGTGYNKRDRYEKLKLLRLESKRLTTRAQRWFDSNLMRSFKIRMGS